MKLAERNALGNTLERLRDTLRHERGEWQQQFDIVETRRKLLTQAEETLAARSAAVADSEKAIKQIEALLGLSTQRLITPSIAEVPKDNVQYLRTYLEFTGSYWIEAVLVRINGIDKLIVLECGCAAFRFTKGELRDGKTCKHIKEYIREYGRLNTYVNAKAALVKAGFVRNTRNLKFPVHYSVG